MQVCVLNEFSDMDLINFELTDIRLQNKITDTLLLIAKIHYETSYFVFILISYMVNNITCFTVYSCPSRFTRKTCSVLCMAYVVLAVG